MGACRDVQIECMLELALLVSEGVIDRARVQAMTEKVDSIASLGTAESAEGASEPGGLVRTSCTCEGDAGIQGSTRDAMFTGESRPLPALPRLLARMPPA
jgi:hypothetical protein